MAEVQPILAGRRVLVVEDEYLIASELAALLAARGAEVLGPAPTLARAHRVLAESGLPDSALLDVNLGGDLVWPIVDLLLKAQVQAILTTGYDAGVIPRRFGHLHRCEKPVSPDLLIHLLARPPARHE